MIGILQYKATGMAALLVNIFQTNAKCIRTRQVWLLPFSASTAPAFLKKKSRTAFLRNLREYIIFLMYTVGEALKFVLLLEILADALSSTW